MSVETLKLWTWQLPQWNITVEKRDLSKVETAWGEDTAGELNAIYGRLHQMLQETNFIFCYTHYEYWSQLEIRRLWVLDVPLPSIFKYTNSEVWEQLLRDYRACGITQDGNWSNLFSDPHVALQEIEKSSPKSSLSTRRSTNQVKIIPLLKVPINKNWVQDSSKCSQGLAYNVAYEKLPRCSKNCGSSPN